MSVLAVIAGATAGWLPSPASAWSVTVFSGQCTVEIDAHLNPSTATVTLSMVEPGQCVTSLGNGTITISGWAGPSSGGTEPGYTCAGGVGVGGLSWEVTSPTRSFTISNARHDLVYAGGAVALSGLRDTVTVAALVDGALVQSPSAAEMCASGINDATWSGTVTFERVLQDGTIRLVHGRCDVAVGITHTGNVVTAGMSHPAACTTNWGPGALRVSGTAGPDGMLPGFDCAGGAGSGGATFDLTTPFVVMQSTNLSFHAAAGGQVMTVEAAEDNAGQPLAWAASLVQQPGLGMGCPMGEGTTSWTGPLVFAGLQIT